MWSKIISNVLMDDEDKVEESSENYKKMYKSMYSGAGYFIV